MFPVRAGSSTRHEHTRILTGTRVHTSQTGHTVHAHPVRAFPPAQVRLWQAHTHAHGYTHSQTRAHMFTRAHVCTQVCTCMHAHPSTSTHTRAHTRGPGQHREQDGPEATPLMHPHSLEGHPLHLNRPSICATLLSLLPPGGGCSGCHLSVAQSSRVLGNSSPGLSWALPAPRPLPSRDVLPPVLAFTPVRGRAVPLLWSAGSLYLTPSCTCLGTSPSPQPGCPCDGRFRGGR